jgi:hypothetical protein
VVLLTLLLWLLWLLLLLLLILQGSSVRLLSTMGSAVGGL